MILFTKKPIEEIAVEIEVPDEPINGGEEDNELCKDIEVSKTVRPDDEVCSNKRVHVTLTIEAKKNLNKVTVTDFLESNFIDSVVKDATTPSTTTGTVVVDNPNHKIIWSISSIKKDDPVTLNYIVIIKDSAINNSSAYVNAKIEIDTINAGKCTKSHGDKDLKDGLNITCPVTQPKVTTLVKNNDKDEYDCDETIHSTLILTLDKQDTGVVITDDLANAFVGVPSTIKVSQGSASVDVNNNIVWQAGTVLADTEIKLEYDITPDQIKTNAGFVTSEVRVDGDSIDPEIVIPRNTENPNYIFLDTFVRDCPEEDGECCCQACEPITVEPCELSKNVTVDVERIKCTGKLIDVTVNLQRVCPGQVLNVGVFLVENVPGDADGDGDIEEGETIQESRGFIVKQVTIPASDTACTSRLVNGFCFPLTDDTGCDADDRTFTAKVFATYINRTVPNCDCDTEPTQEA